MIGTIARLTDKGFGFIKPNEGGDDVFFHARQVMDVMYEDLKEGEAVSYEVVEGRDGRSAAENVKRVA